jgi:tRNA1Val (adenine37-N6)-methyltransferase
VLSLLPELRSTFDQVLCNPPFHHAAGDISPNEWRAQALQDTGDLLRWLECGIKRTASNGTFTVILRADRLNQALAAFPDHGVSIFPLWPKRNEPAKRVLTQLRPGKRTPFALLPGLVLHEEDGSYTREAEVILRGAAALPIF